MPRELSRLETLRGMRISTVEGILATVWSSLTLGAIPQGYALFLGASPFIIGMLSAVQALAGLTTLPSARIVDRRHERRAYVAVIAGGGRILWFIVAFAAIALSHKPALAVLLVVMFVSWSGIQIGVPAWTSWMNDLIPSGLRGRYFARRTIWLSIAAVLAGPLFGRFLDFASERYNPSYAFAALFGMAGVIGVVNMITIFRQPEPPKAPPRTPPPVHPFPEGGIALTRAGRTCARWVAEQREYFSVPLRDVPFRRFLTHVALWVFAQGVAGPFFAIFMLESLHYSYTKVQIVSGWAILCSLIAAPLVGYLVDKYGNRPLYKIAYVGVSIIPLFWALTPVGRPGVTLAVILVAQVLSGVVGAMLGLTQFNLLLRLSPPEHTPRYSAVWSALVGIAGFSAPLVGGALATATHHTVFHAGGLEIGAYKITFLVSMVLRLALIPLLRGLSEPRSEDVRDVLGRMASSSPLGTLKHVRRIRGASKPGVRARSARALGRMKARIGFEELVDALDDPVLSVRRQAAIALGEMGDSRAVEPLLAALANAGAGIRIQAVVSLGKLRDERIVPAILKAMDEDASHDTAFTQAAAQALGNLGSHEAAAPLLEIAEEAEHPARAAAIQSLGELGDESSAEPLTEMLRSAVDLEPQEVSALGDALAKLGDERAVIPLLQRLADTPSMLLRREMANAVATLIGSEGEIYAWMAMDAYDLDAAMEEMLKGHARELRRAGRLSAALRAEAALEALGRDDTARAVHHLLFSLRKAGHTGHATQPAAEALHWIAEQARNRQPEREETLVAVYAYDLALKNVHSG